MAGEQPREERAPERGWSFRVPCPEICAPGLIPYPLLLHGPVTKGHPSKDGLHFKQKTTLFRVTKGRHGSEKLENVGKYPPVIGEGIGPIEYGRLVMYDLDIEEPGRYKLEVSYYVYSLSSFSSSETKRRILVYSEPFEVKASFDNSTIRLSEVLLDLIKEILIDWPNLRELYGNSVASIEGNLNRRPAVSDSPGIFSTS